MGHWGSPYDPLLPLMEHFRGLRVRGFSDLVLQLIFNDMISEWPGTSSGPGVVLSVTPGAIQALGVL